MVFRILPDVQVSPLGGVLMWLFILIALIGVAFASGAGGAVIWTASWLIIFVVAYVVLSNVLKWVF